MPLKNTTTGKVIATSSRLANSLLSRSVGLMFSKPQQSALVMKFEKEEKISLHMMFVFYPIDVLFLNRKKQVVDIKQNFRPFEGYTARKKAKYAIELPAGTIKETKTKIGHEIEFFSVKETKHVNGRSITITKAKK